MNGLSWDQHCKLGDDLRILRDATLKTVQDVYGPSSEVATLAAQAHRAINDLRSALDFLVIEEFTSKPDAHKVYYGRD